MTVDELKEYLEELSEEGYGDTEITIGYQPNYPLEANLKGIVSPEDYLDPDDEDEDDSDLTEEEKERAKEEEQEKKERFVVLVTGDGDRGYGSNHWWDVCQR